MLQHIRKISFFTQNKNVLSCLILYFRFLMNYTFLFGYDSRWKVFSQQFLQYLFLSVVYLNKGKCIHSARKTLQYLFFYFSVSEHFRKKVYSIKYTQKHNLSICIVIALLLSVLSLYYKYFKVHIFDYYVPTYNNISITIDKLFFSFLCIILYTYTEIYKIQTQSKYSFILYFNID